MSVRTRSGPVVHLVRFSDRLAQQAVRSIDSSCVERTKTRSRRAAVVALVAGRSGSMRSCGSGSGSAAVEYGDAGVDPEFASEERDACVGAAVVSAQLAEELPDVVDEQVGGLHGGEVAAAAEFGPVHDSVFELDSAPDRHI